MLPTFSPIKQFFGAVKHCMCMNINFITTSTIAILEGKKISLLACVNEEFFSVRGSVIPGK